MTTVHYPTPASSLPNLEFTWTDQDQNVIDFSVAGWSFQMKIGQPPNSAKITKTAGISGLGTAPNVIVAWDVNELSTSTPGVWYFQLTATYGPSGGKQRIMTGSIRIDQKTM